MEASLEDRATNDQYQHEDNDLVVTVPLMRCLQTLKEKHNTVAKVHRERFEQVKSEPYSAVSRSALNIHRTGSSSRVLFIASRIILCQNRTATHFEQCLSAANL